jgi:hypothetical protein
MFTSFAYALDVNNKMYTLEGTTIAFQQSAFGPGNNGLMYLISADNIVYGVYSYHQNVDDPIVNLGDVGVFYQSPSDILTFIAPPFIVFNPVSSYPMH